MVEERCIYRVNPENSNWTEVKREAWVSSSLFGVSRAVQVSAAHGPCFAPSFGEVLVLLFHPAMLSLCLVLVFSHNPHNLLGSPKPPTPSSVTPARHWGFGQAGTAPHTRSPCMSRGPGCTLTGSSVAGVWSGEVQKQRDQEYQGI